MTASYLERDGPVALSLMLSTATVTDISKKNWRGLLYEAASALAAAGLPEARRHAEWMLTDVLGCSRAHLLAYPQREATPAQAEALAAMVARRIRREPLQYVLGHTGFYGLHLRVTPAVLIPRPETEQVVEAALRLIHGAPQPKVLDVGTGSGCIALALKHARPDAEVYACDVSEAALEVARANAADLGLAVACFRADALAPGFPAHAPGSLDLLVSNPPYVARDEADGLAPEVRDYEPPLALFAGDDPLTFYRAIAQHAAALLQPGGYVVFETHAEHGGAVCDLLQQRGFAAIRLRRDLAGLPRIAHARRPAG